MWNGIIYLKKHIKNGLITEAISPVGGSSLLVTLAKAKAVPVRVLFFALAGIMKIIFQANIRLKAC